jgi:hypothetical protein
MDVSHFEIKKDGDKFVLMLHGVDNRGVKLAIIATGGRDASMWRLGEKCRLNGEFRHLQQNA